MVLSAISTNIGGSPDALRQSCSEYAAYAPVIPTAFGSTQRRMNLDVERQLFPTVNIAKHSVVDTATHNSSLSPPCQVRFSPKTAPFPGTSTTPPPQKQHFASRNGFRSGFPYCSTKDTPSKCECRSESCGLFSSSWRRFLPKCES